VALSAHSAEDFLPHGEHRVLAGETLGVLAPLYGLSVAELAEANDIVDVDLIAAGSILTIPAAAALAPTNRHLSIALSHIEQLYRDARFYEALAATGAAAFDSLDDPTLRARVELLRGKIQTAFGDTEKAHRHFRAALELSPNLELRRPASPKIAAHFRAARADAGRSLAIDAPRPLNGGERWAHGKAER
jgi:LysM repeat protein